MEEPGTLEKETEKSITAETEEKSLAVVKADPTRKRVIGGRKRAGNRIPDDIINDKNLIADMAILPQNYNFEVNYMKLDKYSF